MNKHLRLSRVLVIVILAIILILISLNIPQLSLLLLLTSIMYSLIGTLTSIKNNIISLIITVLALLYLVKPTYTVDIFINSIIPGTIMGIMAKKVFKDKESNKYEPVFVGSIVFMLSIVMYYFICKYAFKIDLLEQLLQMISKSIESQKLILETTSDINLLNTQNITDIFRNMIPFILFCRGMILSIIVYLVEIYVLKKMKYDDLSEIKFTNFYLPGNTITILFTLYLLIMVLSYMNTPLYTDAIFLNLEMIFNFMFIIQGISVSIYFIKRWIKEGVSKNIFIGALCVGIFGMTSVSFIGMIDSILDFRKVRAYKYI